VPFGAKGGGDGDADGHAAAVTLDKNGFTTWMPEQVKACVPLVVEFSLQALVVCAPARLAIMTRSARPIAVISLMDLCSRRSFCAVVCAYLETSVDVNDALPPRACLRVFLVRIIRGIAT